MEASGCVVGSDDWTMLPSDVMREVPPEGVRSLGADCWMSVLRMLVECFEEDIVGDVGRWGLWV